MNNSMAFIDAMDVKDETKRKLRVLCCYSPEALYSLILATPLAVEKYIGADDMKKVVDLLEPQINEETRQKWAALPEGPFSTGAIIDKEPPK